MYVNPEEQYHLVLSDNAGLRTLMQCTVTVRLDYCDGVYRNLPLKTFTYYNSHIILQRNFYCGHHVMRT